jgi:hypothetical protein
MFLTEESISSADSRTERRHEVRTSAHGAVSLRINAAERPEEFHAVVVNSSRRGLCVRHWRKGLLVGEELLLCSPSHSEIPVRVAWNWTVGPVVMSGLQLLQSDSATAQAIDYLETGTSFRRMRVPVTITGITLLVLLLAWYLGR